MQISDEQVAAYKAAYNAEMARWSFEGGHIDPSFEASRVGLAAALSLPVQPVAWPEPKFVPMGGSGMRLNPERVAMLRREINAELVLGEQIQLFSALGLSDYIEPSTTPPVPPTKGPEDDLIAALNEFGAIAREWGATEQSGSNEAMERCERDYESAKAALLALRSRPALPVVGVKHLEWIEDFREGTFVRFAAETPIGIYRCQTEFAVVTPVGIKTCLPGWRGPFDSAYHDATSIDAAQVSAQSHFDAAIRSALTPSVQP